VTQYVVQIGPVGLHDLEVPSEIDFGGSQRLVVHKLQGGREVVERLGAEPKAIRFGGIFTGQNAASRYRALDAIRRTGQAVWLTWGSFRYWVIIQDLEAKYENLWWIRFSIVCAVVQNAGGSGATDSIVQQILADLTNVMTVASGLSLDSSSLVGALNAPQAFLSSTTDQQAALSATGGMLGDVNSSITSASNAMSSEFPSAATGTNLSSGVTSLVSTAGDLASAVNIRGYLMRIQNTLGG
jgi:hypothetical protein